MVVAGVTAVPPAALARAPPPVAPVQLLRCSSAGQLQHALTAARLQREQVRPCRLEERQGQLSLAKCRQAASLLLLRLLRLPGHRWLCVLVAQRRLPLLPVASEGAMAA